MTTLDGLVAMDVAGRLGRLRDGFDAAGVDALVVTTAQNVRYLTGFTGSAGQLVVTGDAAVLVTDGRYREQAALEVAAAGVACRLEITSTAVQEVVVSASGRARRIGLEATTVSWSQQRAFAEWFADREVVATEGLVEALRERKDAGEVARIERAAGLADDALLAVLPMLLEGPPETEVALALEIEMRRRGAKGPSFETIVASGPNAARPHHRPGPRRVERGDLVVVDFGALVDGYRSDMTRTVIVADATPEQQRLYAVVREAQAAGVAAVGPSVVASSIDRACRAVIEDAGWGDQFVHGTGHGVGLDIHEAPWVNARSAATLAAGHVVTVEPGVYLPGFGGVRVEDTVLVTPDGARPVTHAPKDPLVV